jgi:hypothetical protein
MMGKYSPEEILQADKIIHSLAHYDVYKGQIYVPESMEDILETQKKIASRFNELKILVKNGTKEKSTREKREKFNI